MACDMPQPHELPSLNTCHEGFLWAHKEVVDLAPHSVFGLVLPVGDAKLPEAPGLENLDLFFSESASGRASTASGSFTATDGVLCTKVELVFSKSRPK